LIQDIANRDREIVLLPIDYQVLVNIREFDGTLGGMVNLNADWTVASKGKDKSIVTRKSVLEEQADGAGYDAYVAAQSRLLKKLSQDITAEKRLNSSTMRLFPPERLTICN
jgi:uncharacterized lipoprotein YmbA